MSKLKAMIVDDSSFSITILKSLLEKKGFEIVCEAQSIAEVKSVILTCKPDLVTMDMTLSDGDGIEATKLILNHCPNSKVMAISAMMDAEIIKKAKDSGVKSYIQKPIDEDEFNSAIDKLFAGEELYRLLSENYFGAFRESLISYLKRLEAAPLVQNEEQTNENIKSKKSSGISVTIGIIGRHCGRLVIDMSDDTIIELAKRALNKSELAKDEMIAFFGEFGNIVGGNACSMLNTFNRGLSLRVSPPTIFHGKDLTISIGEIKSTSLVLKSNAGEIFMNIGFQRGDDEWM